MTDTTSQGLTIRHAKAADAPHVLEFQDRHLNEGYLLRRDQAFIAGLVTNRQMFVISDDATGAIVGICYVTYDVDASRWEVGGIYVEDAFRKLGVAKILGRVAVATLFNVRPPNGIRHKLIAHVHRDNEKPINLLRESFFEIDGEELRDPPEELTPDDDGIVRARVFTFCQGTLVGLADWFDGFPGSVGSGDQWVTVTLQADLWTDRWAAMSDLRELGQQCAGDGDHGCKIIPAGGA